MRPTLDDIRECLEGAVPGVMATCAPDGTPNVSYLSHVEYVDREHVALSFQFFSKTRQNVLANPRARVLVTHPVTAARHRLSVHYLRTETSGPLFERMKAKLAGIASHTGMTGVFRLLGADVYRVLAVERVPAPSLPAPARANLLPALRCFSERLARSTDLDAALTTTLDVLESDFGVQHAAILFFDRAHEHLYVVASRGYDRSGIGGEIPVGRGVIGVAARELTPIRLAHVPAEYGYGRALRDASSEHGSVATEIPPPGLHDARSQLAVPIVAMREPLGVLFVESRTESRFTYDDEDALVAVGRELGLAARLLQASEDAQGDGPAPDAHAQDASGGAVVVRHYAENDSVFMDDDYLIKGVAGAIFWSLVRDYVERGRTVFTNRELRVDPRIGLPELSDNLEARLILLRRRLDERSACARIEKVDRGRFRLRVERPLRLVEVGAG